LRDDLFVDAGFVSMASRASGPETTEGARPHE